MFKKTLAFIVSLVLVLSLVGPSLAAGSKSEESVFATEQAMTKGELDPKADNNTAKNKGKVILIDLNRTRAMMIGETMLAWVLLGGLISFQIHLLTLVS